MEEMGSMIHGVHWVQVKAQRREENLLCSDSNEFIYMFPSLGV